MSHRAFKWRDSCACAKTGRVVIVYDTLTWLLHVKMNLCHLPHVATADLRSRQSAPEAAADSISHTNITCLLDIATEYTIHYMAKGIWTCVVISGLGLFSMF